MEESKDGGGAPVAAMPPLSAHAQRMVRDGRRRDDPVRDPRIGGRLRSQTRARQPPVSSLPEPSPPRQDIADTALPSPSTSPDDQNMGLLAHVGRDALLSIIANRSLVSGGEDVGGASRGAGGGGAQPDFSQRGMPIGLAVRMVRAEEIDAAIRDGRPPDARPEMPQCLASDLRVPKTFREANLDEYSGLWCDAMQREFYGILNSGVLAPIPESE